MKKIFKVMLCLTLSACLCLMGSVAAFAADTAPDSEASLDELLELLQVLGSSSEDEASDNNEEAVTADFAEYTVNSFTFAIPSDWQSSDMDDSMSFFSNDFSTFVSVYSADASEGVDIFDEENLNALVETMGGEDAIKKAEQVYICGYPAIWIEASVEEDGISSNSYVLLIQAGEEAFYMTLTELSGNHLAEFAQIVESISIDGATGETDISSAYDAELAPVSIASAAPTAENKPANKDNEDLEGIDATEFDEIILADTDEVTISMKDFAVEDYHPLAAVVFTDNKSDLNLYVTLDDVSVNGYMIDPWFGKTVSAGHKSNDDMSFYSGEFEENGIREVRDLEFTLIVRDDDDYFADPIVKETFIIYPFGKDVPEQPAQEIDDDAIALIDNGEFTMIITGFEQDDYYFSANVYMENNSDDKIDFNVSGNTTVNGYDINPYFLCSVQAGKKANASIKWYCGDLEENEIETVEELGLDISISESDDWFADPIYTDFVNVQVQ